MAADTIRFRSDVTVELRQAMAADADVIHAARVSTLGQDSRDSDGASAGLINYLMRSRHGSPFEHNAMTFFVQAPIFVFREFHRHRIASYNEESARYRELNPVFYVPGPARNLQQIGKPGHYTFVAGTLEQQALVTAQNHLICTAAYASYQLQLEAGIAREVARNVLPFSIYSSMYVTMNARALMNFLSLRIANEDALYPSSPLWEIEMCAQAMEAAWSRLMPLTHAAFNKHRRVAP